MVVARVARRKSVSTTKALQPARDVNYAQRQIAAVSLRRRGMEWQDIAESLGIKGGKGAAYHLVNSALKAELSEEVEELRRLQGGQLRELLTVFYPKAMAGDGWSMDRCMRIFERRAALFAPDMRVDQQHLTAQVLVREYPAGWIEGV